MKRKNPRPSLLVRVWTELGVGHITEEPELKGDKGERLHGLCFGRHIWVNPTWSTVDTVVHELLHRLHPHWSERYVRNRTAFLMNRMTDDEVLAFFEEYEKRAKKRRRRERSGISSPRGRLVEDRTGEGPVPEVRGGAAGDGGD